MDASLVQAIEELPQIQIDAGEVLITEGRKPDGLYFLKSGSVDIIKGSARVATEAQPGAIFGEISLLLDFVGTATVRARVASEFYAARDGLRFLSDHPDVGFVIARTLALRLEAVTHYVADLKTQFKSQASPLGMVDSVVETLLAKHPRHVQRRNRGH